MKKMKVRLRNSKTEELRSHATIIHTSLDKLRQELPMAFYDAAMIARDKNYRSSGIKREGLVKLAFIDKKDIMHEITRNIVLACIKGDMQEMRLVNPIAKEKKE